MTFREQLQQAHDGFTQAAMQNANAGKWVQSGENSARANLIEQILAMASLDELERLAALAVERIPIKQGD